MMTYNLSGDCEFIPTAVRVFVLTSPMTVATPKSPTQMFKSSSRKMLLGFKSLNGNTHVMLKM